MSIKLITNQKKKKGLLWVSNKETLCRNAFLEGNVTNIRHHCAFWTSETNALEKQVFGKDFVEISWRWGNLFNFLEMANHADILMTGKAAVLLIRAFVNRFLYFFPTTKFRCCQRSPLPQIRTSINVSA